MEVSLVIYHSTIKSSGTTRSAVVYSILADVLVISITSTSLSQEATIDRYKHNYNKISSTIVNLLKGGAVVLVLPIILLTDISTVYV